MRRIRKIMSRNDKICRLCLGDKPSLHIFENGMSVFIKIQTCCTVQMTENDGLPNQICSICASTLDVVVNFKTQCEESDKILRNKISLNDVKEEEISPVKDEISYENNISPNIDEFFERNYGEHSILHSSLKNEHNNFDDENASTLSEENSFMKLVSYQRQVRVKKFTKKLNNNISFEGKTLKTKSRSNKQCPSCGKIFLKLSSLNKHVLRHNLEKPFKCGICSKDYDYIEKLKEHLQSHDNEHPCEICGKVFKRPYDVRRHIKVVHNKSTDIGYRNYNTSTPYMDIDHSEGDICNIIKTEIDDICIYDSTKNDSDAEKDFPCLGEFDDESENLNASKTITKKFSLIENMSNRISKDKKRTPRTRSTLCPFCGKLFLRLASMNKHIKSHSEAIVVKPHLCVLCSKAFRYEKQLKDHIKTHVDTREYPCDTCDKMFKTSYDARRHSDIVHKRKRMAQCKVCGDKLATSSGLKKHLLIHTGEKPYECDFCQQQFTFKNSLVFHLRTHTGEKPYACKYCDARFSLLRSVKDHERLHTGETPYLCPVCAKGFTQLSNMKSHFRNNHKGVEFKYQFKKSKKFKEGHMSKL